MQNGYWDSDLLEILEPDFPNLLVSAPTQLIGYAGWQWVAVGLAAEIRAMAREFRTATGKALTVREAFRTLDTQKYYYAHPQGGVAAYPGTSNHGLGLALDVWSGIDVSFTSPEHVAFEAIAKRRGWTNTGRNFGEPWHFEKTGSSTVTPSTGGATTPVEEDDMYTADDRTRDEQAAKDASITKGKANVAMQTAQANAEKLDELKVLVTRVLALDSNGLTQVNDRAFKAATRAQDILDILKK